MGIKTQIVDRLTAELGLTIHQSAQLEPMSSPPQPLPYISVGFLEIRPTEEISAFNTETFIGTESGGTQEIWTYVVQLYCHPVDEEQFLSDIHDALSVWAPDDGAHRELSNLVRVQARCLSLTNGISLWQIEYAMTIPTIGGI